MMTERMKFSGSTRLLSAIGIFLAAIEPKFVSSFKSPLTSTFHRPSKLWTRHILYSSTQLDNHYGFSHDLIQGLDLKPLLHGVAAHAGTRRGRQAILSLVGDDENEPKNAASGMSSRSRRVSDPFMYRRSEQISSRNVELAPIAKSAKQAREEYELSEQALLALHGTNGLSFPPIYGANSSPFDSTSVADSDHDDWIFLPGDQVSLEHVLQAEQVINMLIQVKEWSNKLETEIWIPSLSSIGKGIVDEILIPIQHELDGTIEIARVKSLTDPNGRSTFCFRLKDSKFPLLKELRRQEEQLTLSIDTAMRSVLRKQKGSPECVEFEGRKVLLIPKSSASSEIGIIRGLTENGGRYYVEPRDLVNLGDELQQLREELRKTEAILEHQLVQTVLKAASPIDAGLNAVARLDVVFSKAAFGLLLNGKIPTVGEYGRIKVDRFIHPILALQNKNSVVPVDLRMYNDQHSNRVLIISGPNGGGKSLVMKSFGLACILVKLAIPIPSASTDLVAVVDFFDSVLLEMGDQQNVSEGESTFMARLNSLSAVIQRLLPPTVDGNRAQESITTSSLVLLDELGGGTDPNAGGAIAQAILEKLLESRHCRIVVTTHSPRLKALSYSSNDYDCATVLLKKSDQSDFKLPTYQLQYGLIGDSYALGAASRASPSLPEDVLSRAGTLLSTLNTSNNDNYSSGELLRAMTESLEKQIQAAEECRQQADETQQDVKACRDALMALSNAYLKQLGKLEDRLETVFKELQEDESKSSLVVVGESLATIRTAKKKVTTEDERLKRMGLKRVSDSYKLSNGESVVVLAPGDWEGVSGTIVSNGIVQCKPGEVLVAPSLGTWEDLSFQRDELRILDPSHAKPLILRRHQIAVWDFDSVWDGENSERPTSTVRESRQKLVNLLNSLPSTSTMTANKKVSETSRASTFNSSRERKASASKKQKKKN